MVIPEHRTRRLTGEDPGTLVVRLYHPVLRAVIPVSVTYVLAVIGLRSGLAGDFQWQGQGSSLATKTCMVLLFTVTHAVVPAFMYRVFTSAPVIKYFGYLHMGFWFGVPMVFLASQTGWLSLAAPVVNVATARKGTRAWVFLQYGSTSFALLLFLGMFHREAIFPAGIVVVLAQALLLTGLELFARPWWVGEHGGQREPTAEDVRVFLSQDPPRRIPAQFRRLTSTAMLLYAVGAFFGGFGTFAILPFAVEEGLTWAAFVGLFAVLGWTIVFFTWRHRHRLMEMLQIGIFTHGEVEAVQRTDVTVDDQRRYRVRVRYEIQGTAYPGGYFAYGAEVTMARKRHKSGQSIAILYDPANPERLLLAEPGARWTGL